MEPGAGPSRMNPGKRNEAVVTRIFKKQRIPENAAPSFENDLENYRKLRGMVNIRFIIISKVLDMGKQVEFLDIWVSLEKFLVFFCFFLRHALKNGWIY